MDESLRRNLELFVFAIGVVFPLQLHSNETSAARAEIASILDNHCRKDPTGQAHANLLPVCASPPVAATRFQKSSIPIRPKSSAISQPDTA